LVEDLDHDPAELRLFLEDQVELFLGLEGAFDDLELPVAAQLLRPIPGHQFFLLAAAGLFAFGRGMLVRDERLDHMRLISEAAARPATWAAPAPRANGGNINDLSVT